MKNFTQSIQNLLANSNGELKQLLEQVKKLDELNEAVLVNLPSPINKHCRVVHLDKGKLLLEVDNSSFAAKLHYIKPELMSKLRKLPQFAFISTIEVKINMPSNPTKPKKQQRRSIQLTEDNKQAIEGCLNSVTDPKLKNSLLQLLKHAEGY